jgi:hypothetical protein
MASEDYNLSIYLWIKKTHSYINIKLDFKPNSGMEIFFRTEEVTITWLCTPSNNSFELLVLVALILKWAFILFVKKLLPNIPRKWTWSQFHQHFTCTFLPIFWRQKLQSCVLGLEFFGAKISAKKVCVKGWWNWHLHHNQVTI